MQSARIILSIFLLVSAAATVSSSSAKLRRDGVLNLYPFPRVGRSHHTWQVPINEPNEHLDNEMASKRQLYAFPRVGRNNFGYPDQYQNNLNRLNVRLEDILLGQPRSHEYVKRDYEDVDSGMWFGPRVGRSFSYGDMDRYYANDRSDPEVPETENVERNKRQTKHF